MSYRIAVLNPSYSYSAVTNVESATLSESLNSASVLEFSVYDSNAQIDNLVAAVGAVVDNENVYIPSIICYRMNGDSSLTEVFSGRVYEHKVDDLTECHTFVCEGMLAYLNDLILSPYHFTGTPRDFLNMIIRNGTLFRIGNVTVTDSNDYIIRSNEKPSNMWSEIAEKCIGSSLGGFLEVRDGVYLDWLSSPSAGTSTQGITRGINLRSLNYEEQPREQYSAVYVYGADTGSTNQYGQKEYLELSYTTDQGLVPSGYTLTPYGYVSKDSLVAEIGKKIAILHYQDITLKSNLVARAKSFLDAQSAVSVIQLGAVDLVDAGYGDEYDVDSIECGQTVTITGNYVSGERHTVTSITRDLLDPSNSTFEFGNTAAITSGSASASAGGYGGNLSEESPYFWHSQIPSSSTQPYDLTLTGFSTNPLEDVLTSVVNRTQTLDGGAMWLQYIPPYNNIPYKFAGFELRANQLIGRFFDPQRTTYTSLVSFIGGNVSLRSNYTLDTAKAGELDINGYSGGAYLRSSDPYLYAGNSTNQAQLHLDDTGRVGVKTSTDSGATWSAMQYIGGNLPYAGSPVSGGNATRTNGILFGQVDSTSTSTEYTATVSGLTSLYDGAAVMLKNGVVTSAAGFTVNVNNLGAKPVYSNLAAATQDTTIFNVNYTMLFVYDSSRVSGGCWICYRGYDANTNTIGYQLRTNSSTLTASDKGYRYRLWFTSADGTQWVPANTSTATNATTARALNTRKIDPFGPIVYYGTNGTTEANAALTANTLWQQYTLTIGYSYMASGFSLTTNKPVYLKATPQSDGSAVMNSIVQALPTTDDGYIYIFLGVAYSATAMELRAEHPVYYKKNGALRLWTGASSTDDYTQLSNKPSIKSVTLTGDKTFSDLGLKPATNAMIAALFD